MHHRPVRLAAAAALTIGLCACGSRDALQPPTIPQGKAEEAARAVIDALGEGNPVGLWTGMPKAWQHEINGIVRAFGERMDPELYDEAFGLLGRFATQMRKNKDFFLGHPRMQGMPAMQRQALEQNLDEAVAMVQVLADSDLGRVAALRNFDGCHFLQTSGAELQRIFFQVAAKNGVDARAQIAGVGITTVSSDADRQVLLFTAPGEKNQELAFRKVEGCWVPEAMATGYERFLSQTQSGMAAIPSTTDPAFKAQTRMILGTMRNIVEQIEGAKSDAELRAIVDGLTGMASKPN